MPDVFDIAAGNGGDVFDQAAATMPRPRQHGIVDAFKGAGARVAQGINSAAGSMLDTFGLDEGAAAYKEGADYWRKIAEESGSAGIPAKVYEGIGAAPQGVAEFMAGVPYAAVKGAAKGYKEDGATGLVKEALVEAIKRYGIGKVFHGIQNANLTPVKQSAAMAGTMGAQAAAEGGSLQDVVASTVTGAALMPPGGNGRAAVVRGRLMKEGVTPEIATDLAGRVPESVPAYDPSYTDWEQFPGTEKPELIRDPETLPARTEMDAARPKDVFDQVWDEMRYPAVKDKEADTRTTGELLNNVDMIRKHAPDLLRNPEEQPARTDSTVIADPVRQPVWDDPRYPGISESRVSENQISATARPDTTPDMSNAQISPVEPLELKPLQPPAIIPDNEQGMAERQPEATKQPNEISYLYAGIHPRKIARANDYLKSTKVGQALATAWDGIKRGVSPTLRGDQAMKAGEVITEQLGRVSHETERFVGDINRGVSALRGAVDRKTKALDLLNSSSRTLADSVFAKMPETLRLDFMQKMDTGGRQATPELQQIADTIDTMFKDKARQVQELGTGALQQVRENYFPHIWERSGNTEAEVMARISRSPLEGGKDFTKARVFDDVQAGLDAGYKPISTNPMDLTLLKMAEMDKYILAHKSMQALEGQGVQAIPFAEKTPQGMADINGRFGSFDRNGQKMRYVAEDQVAQVINNFTSQSLYNNKYVGTLYRAIRAIGNTLNMFQLGVGSAFHAGFTSGEAVVSHVALGMKEFARGNVKEGAKYMTSAPVAWLSNAKKGDAVLKAFTGEHTSADAADIVEYLRMAGAQKQNPNERYFSSQTQKMMENWSDRKFAKAFARSPIAAVEQMARPIMEWLVPRHKFGVFAEMAEQWARNHPNATHESTRSAMQQIWNRVDSRLGQVVYTRLFSHNVAKNVAQMTIRAPGWTGGTILEVGGGVKDLADMVSGGAKRAGKGFELSDQAAYTLSLMLVTAVTNGTLTAAFTGEAPSGMDFLAFRDGGTDEKGKATRFLLPTYAKDIYAYYQHPVKTLTDKTHPLFSVIADIARNKDYYGVQIADPEASIPEKTYQIGRYAAKAFIPFWMRGAQKTIDREGGFSVMAQQGTSNKVRDAAKIAAPFIGVMPATSAFTKSPLEKYMNDQMPKNEQAITQEDADHKKAVYALANKIVRLQQSGAPLEPVIQQARDMIAAGTLTERDIKRIDKIIEVPQIIRQFEKLPVRAAIKAFNELASDEERVQLVDVYVKKMDRFSEDKPAQFETMKDRILKSIEHIKRIQSQGGEKWQQRNWFKLSVLQSPA